MSVAPTGGSETRPYEGALRPIAFATLAALALLWVYDATTLRPLFADGFLYFLRILEREAYWLEAPARRTVEIVRQVPLLAALKLGAADAVGAEALAVVFGLSLQLVPLGLVALCWPALPRAKKALFVFPLLHYVAGTLGAAFGAIAEGPTAAAYFWLLFLVLLFRPPRGGWLVLVAALSLGAVVLHEGMALLAPVLAAAAVWRVRHESARAARLVFAALALWFVAAAVVEARFILEPSHPGNRTLYTAAMLSFWWLRGHWGSVNLPALFGLLGLVVLASLWLWNLTGVAGPGRRFEAVFWAAFGAACLAAVIREAAADRMMAAGAQLNARNHPLLISLPLALAVLWIAAKPAAARRLPFRSAALLSAWLAAAALVWHAEAARRWSDYVGAFREALRTHRGLVGWEELVAKLPPAERRLWVGMSHFWIEPAMSIVLAPGGRVATIVAARREARWYPFDARRPEELPRARFWNYDDYLAALKR